MSGYRCCAWLAGALASALAFTGASAAGDDIPNWCGEFMSSTDILGIANCGKGQSFAFGLSGRNEPDATVDGVAGLEAENSRHGSGYGLDFTISEDDNTITVTLEDDYPERQPGDERYDAVFQRIESVEMRDDALVAVESGKVLVASRDDLQAVENADLRFAPISSYQVEESHLAVRPGLYVVDENDEVRYLDQTVTAILGEDGEPMPLGPEEFGDAGPVSLSLDRDILAVNLSYEPTGHWFFFSWPDLEALEHPVAESFMTNTDKALLWSGSHQVVLDVMNADTKRACEYDPCGPVSVTVFDIDSGETTILKKGTDLCEYRTVSVKKGKVRIGKTCKASPEDWATYPDEPDKIISVALP